jgi:general secretion pathway protein G
MPSAIDSPAPKACQRDLRRPAGRTNGFTLVEMLVVVVIVAILATIALPVAQISHRRGQEEELRRALRDIRSALDRYKQLGDEGRIERRAGSSGFPPSLDVLVDGIPDAKSPNGQNIYLLRSLPRDPFAPSDSGSAAATWALRSYASPPSHPQAGEDVFDVHSKSAEMGLNGIVYAAW